MKYRNQTNFVLASASPRRQDLMKAAGFGFAVIIPQVVEERLPNEDPATYALRNSALKCDWVADHLPENLSAKPGIIIAADTIVVMGQKVLEKPSDTKHATEMLSQLSNRTHQVMTGFCIRSVNVSGAKKMQRVVHTDVEFKSLSDDEIARYIATGECMDKAGSYGAQGAAGYLIRRIIGSYTNVIGLPMAELMDVLESDFANQWS